LALGRLCYAVAYLEWTILGYLSRFPRLPAELQVEQLAGETTGRIGRRLTDPSLLANVSDPQVRAWPKAGGDHLIAAATLRNSVLHARPATIDGQPRLYRSDPRRQETFAVSDGLLAELLREIQDRIHDMASRRVRLD
jgi:hypothetical protein